MMETKLKFKIETLKHETRGDFEHHFRVGIISGVTSNETIFVHTEVIRIADTYAAEKLAHQKTYNAFAEKMRKLLND